MSRSSSLFSVLIGTKDRPEALIRCLRSILAQRYQDLEILVLDDNSNESVDAQIGREFTDERIKCIRSETTLGVAGGRNKLIKEAKGEFLLTLDDDAVLRDNDSFDRLVGLFDSYPDVGLFSLKIIDIVEDKQVGVRVPFRKGVIKRQPDIVDSAQYASYFLGGGARRT